jgi:hypothetical protein
MIFSYHFRSCNELLKGEEPKICLASRSNLKLWVIFTPLILERMLLLRQIVSCDILIHGGLPDDSVAQKNCCYNPAAQIWSAG